MKQSLVFLFVFILSTISPCTTGLNTLYDPFDYTNTVQLFIILTERQMHNGDHLSMSQRFFKLPQGIGPSDRGPQVKVVIQATMYLSVHGIEPASSVFLGQCVLHYAPALLLSIQYLARGLSGVAVRVLTSNL